MHPIVDVHVLLIRGHMLLLTQRKGGYGDGMWHLPSGKLDEDESLAAGAARETWEEVGVVVQLDDLRLVHTVHVRDSGPHPRIGFFFAAEIWAGEPENREPDKCGAVRWFAFDQLPLDVIPYPRAGISGYIAGTSLTITGWGGETQLVRPEVSPVGGTR